MTDSPRNWAASPDEPYCAARPDPDQCEECRAAPNTPHAPGCDRLPSCTEDSSGGQRTCIDDDFPAARSAIGAGPVFGYEPSADLQRCRQFANGDNDRFSCRPIPLWEQALWLARHIESVTSPRPDVVSDDEIRGLTLIRVLGIGADEYGDAVFRKSSAALRQDAAEEWSDAEWYDLVERFGDELR